MKDLMRKKNVMKKMPAPRHKIEKISIWMMKGVIFEGSRWILNAKFLFVYKTCKFKFTKLIPSMKKKATQAKMMQIKIVPAASTRRKKNCLKILKTLKFSHEIQFSSSLLLPRHKQSSSFSSHFSHQSIQIQPNSLQKWRKIKRERRLRDKQKCKTKRIFYCQDSNRSKSKILKLLEFSCFFAHQNSILHLTQHDYH